MYPEYNKSEKPAQEGAEETKQEEIKQEETKQEETKQEETKQEETKEEETKQITTTELKQSPRSETSESSQAPVEMLSDASTVNHAKWQLLKRAVKDEVFKAEFVVRILHLF